MNDRRSEPGQPRKRAERAAGASPRRGSDDAARRNAGGFGRSPDRARRSAEDDFGAPPGRRAGPDDGRRSAGRRRAEDGSEQRRRRPDQATEGAPDSGRVSRRPDRSAEPPGRRSSEPRAAGRGGRQPREEAEPGFGPFRGGRRAATPAGGGRDAKRVDDEADTVRSVAEEAVARASGTERTPLRIVHRRDGSRAAPPAKREQGATGKGKTTRRTVPAPGPPVGQRPKPVRDGGRLQEAIVRGARALERGYEREALRILRPWRDAHPDSADLRELLGVTYYRLGRWTLAQKELEEFVALTGSTEQHPVLMDCARALGRFDRVRTLWEELRAASPAAEIVTEGRIVAAGALADEGRLDEAIRLLERAPATPKRVRPHHLRLWYALADLHERAGDIPAARALFRKVSAQDPAFVDVAERLAALS